MAQFRRPQFAQLVVFCLYWFVVFPLIWFVVQPEFFANNIVLTLLFALLLLVIYYLIYCLIKCCCYQKKDETTAANSARQRNRHSNGHGTRGRHQDVEGIENRVYAPTTTTASNASTAAAAASANRQPKRIQMPDAVLYENVPAAQKGLLGTELPSEDEAPEADEDEAKTVRFITSCSLYYDGQGHFHDYK